MEKCKLAAVDLILDWEYSKFEEDKAIGCCIRSLHYTLQEFELDSSEVFYLGLCEVRP